MADLEALYKDADYVVEDGDTRLTIRLGLPNGELQQLLRSRNASVWAYLTACNPLSQPLTDEENGI